MTEKEKTYRLSGSSFTKQELIDLCREKTANDSTEDFKKEIYSFILEWFSDESGMVVKTSGSTGKPKEIRLLKKHMEASARATRSFFGLKPGDTLLHCLPMRYIAGKMMVVRALVGGLDLYITEPSGKPEIMPEHVSFSAMVPLQLSGLLQTTQGTSSLERIDKLIVGGAFVPESLERRVQGISTRIWQTYGMTETITHIALRKLNGTGRSEWYKPLPGVSVRLNENNCLVIDAPDIGVTNLATNDLALTGEGDLFRITGRLDHVVISGGIKLHPEALEKKVEDLMPFPFFLAGLPDKLLGNRLVLFLEQDTLSPSEEETLRHKLKERLSAYESPKDIICLGKFEYNSQGKLMRRNMVEHYLNLLT